MARYNEILSGRYNRFLQKLFSMKGPPPAPQLSSDISTVLPLMHGRENRYLEGWQIFGARALIAGVAAQDTVIRLNNPPTSNVIAVVESIKMVFGAAAEGFLEYANTAGGDLATVVTAANFDNRTNPPGAGTNGAGCRLSGTNNVAQGAAFIFDDIALPNATQTTPDFIAHTDQEIPLMPNSHLQFRTFTLNIQVSMSVRWRERPLEDSERT